MVRNVKRKLCEEIDSTDSTATLHKDILKDRTDTISALRKSDGSFYKEWGRRSRFPIRLIFQEMMMPRGKETKEKQAGKPLQWLEAYAVAGKGHI